MVRPGNAGHSRAELSQTESTKRKVGLSVATNIDVIASFLSHNPSRGSISTDGKELRSYDAVIAKWDGDKVVMPGSSVFYSVTTSKHRGLVRSMALNKGIHVVEIS